MLRLRSASLATALAAGVYCLSFATPVQEAPRAPYGPATEGLVLSGSPDRDRNESMTLEQLVVEFGRITGEHVIYTKDTEMLLASIRVDLGRPMEIAPAAVWGTVETLLRTNKFVLTDLRREEPRMLCVSSLDSQARTSVRASARFVPIDEVPLYREHCAFLIQTVVALEHLDVRTLGNTLRQYIVDPNTLVFLPIPEARSMIVVGFADEVGALAEILRELDARAAVLAAERPAEEEE